MKRPWFPVQAINFQVRKKASQIRLSCRYQGPGTVQFELIGPKKVYTEDDLTISERITLKLNGATGLHREKAAALHFKEIEKPEEWTAYLTPRWASILQIDLHIE